MSLSKLSKLPPEVLSSVLNNRAIPLCRRLRLRLLSNRWCDIIEDALKKETSLAVREKNCFNPIANANDLIIKPGGLTEEIIRTLGRLFFSLTELSLVFGEWPKNPPVSWSTVPSLLAQLGTNLTAVKLCGRIAKAVAKPLASALAALSNLTSLTLDDYEICEILLPHLAPVLSRLETFADAYSPQSASLLSSSLSPRCTRLLLDQKVFTSFPGALLSQLSANLMHLHLVGCNHTTVWESISQMHGLTSLALGFNLDEPTELDSSLLRRLAPFSRLTDLKLICLAYRAPLALPSKKEKPLSTIQRLTLEFWNEDSPIDYQAFFKSIRAWFPALTKLTLITDEDKFPDIRASQGKLPFSVETVDVNSFNRLAF